METQLKLVRLLSLKEMALRRVVALLWSTSDVLASTLDFTHSFSYKDGITKEWRETIENKIREKMSKLELPESLLNQMTDMVRPVGFQVKRWLESHKGFLSAAKGFLSTAKGFLSAANKDSPKLCWTTAGTINYLKTAELLLGVVESRDDMCEKPTTSTRDDSLEIYITHLWNELSSEGMELTLHRNNQPLDLDGVMLSNGLKFAFSLQKCNKTAAEYFFQKLSRKEREVILTIIVRDDLLNLSDDSEADPERGTSEVLCYLLSLLTPEQQMEIVKSRPIDVLLCFFHWPWQDLLLLNAGLVWTFIPASRYGDLFWKMISYFREGDYYFPKSFQEFFIRSPPDFKKYFMESEVGGLWLWDTPVAGTPAKLFLYVFFEYEDSECIEVIFRNVDAASRVEFVLCHDVFDLFYLGISKDRWHLVEICLREAALGEEDRQKLQRDFMRYLKERDEPTIQLWESKWKRFFDYLDGANTSANKDNKKKLKLENCCPEK